METENKAMERGLRHVLEADHKSLLLAERAKVNQLTMQNLALLDDQKAMEAEIRNLKKDRSAQLLLDRIQKLVMVDEGTETNYM